MVLAMMCCRIFFENHERYLEKKKAVSRLYAEVEKRDERWASLQPVNAQEPINNRCREGVSHR